MIFNLASKIDHKYWLTFTDTYHMCDNFLSLLLCVIILKLLFINDMKWQNLSHEMVHAWSIKISYEEQRKDVWVKNNFVLRSAMSTRGRGAYQLNPAMDFLFATSMCVCRFNLISWGCVCVGDTKMLNLISWGIIRRDQ